jgi:PIN domain nuclease of toxin-antitoxin system
LKVLLDTHIFLWAISDYARLSSRAGEVIRDSDNEVLVSIASAWEIAIKVGIGKFVMPVPLAPYLQRQLVKHRIGVLSIQLSHLAMLEKLPLHHRDPFDRLLVAQCLEEDATLITVDSQLQRYPVRIVS